ncbi:MULTISPECIES: DUF4168 domain-containing protein [unclassified Leptolyngbya]|uniref:DUF4168 domain-containing protein n=1 Tax=unclassified Leptolyngbya TaxID=2650499 RepID=UPI0016846013|nr:MULTISPECIES: DUF4168 domain-containing protein [unclassified Leptolyngbya]MBD1913725.1 DUF4168 domain-containing protein [Leptolyngbya sp. FACHB-8]MBD2155686.1 DUF4168 domain-containing protein [Leptolyngbya sp. FACHB-16]
MTQSSRSLAIPVHPRISRWLTISALSATGLLMGWVPNLSLTPNVAIMGQSAQAQAAISDADIRNYARSVLTIESRRQEALQNLRNASPNQQVPNIRCNDRNSLNGLPRQARTIAVEYCTVSQQVVEQNSLTIQRFNQITAAQQGDRNLAQRIQQELIRLQQNR